MRAPKKVLTAKEKAERARKKLRRTPEINPESVQNRTVLVTIHQAGRAYVGYHGNNVNTAREIAAMKTIKPFKSSRVMGKGGVIRYGGTPIIAKVWMCTSMFKQEV